MHSKGKGKCFHSGFTKLHSHVGTPFLFFKWHCGWKLFGKYTTGLHFYCCISVLFEPQDLSASSCATQIMLASVVFINIVKSVGQKGKCVVAERRTHVLFQWDRKSGIHGGQSATGTVLH